MWMTLTPQLRQRKNRRPGVYHHKNGKDGHDGDATFLVPRLTFGAIYSRMNL